MGTREDGVREKQRCRDRGKNEINLERKETESGKFNGLGERDKL